MNTADMIAVVRAAWADIPAPPASDLERMAWGWGEQALQAFAGVAPVDVDTTSAGFLAATPLLDLPPGAAASYLGTFLLALLRSIEGQERSTLFHDVVTRAHTLNCLTQPSFWRRVIRPHVTPAGRDCLARLVPFLESRREVLALTEQQTSAMRSLVDDD